MSEHEKVPELDAKAATAATGAQAASPLPDTYRTCLVHAADLIDAAERALVEPAFPHIAYHLAALALEEVGKGGMIAARYVVGSSRDSEWMNRRFGDHVWKLQWAIWSPALSTGRIDPKDFEEARRFAQCTHGRRKAGLYVNQDGTSAPPRSAVSMDDAKSLLKIAKGRLELERAGGEPVLDTADDNREWFLNTMSDEVGKRRMLSKEFRDKHEDLKGDTRAWVTWARQQFERIATDEEAYLKRELARVPSTGTSSEPKWNIKVRLYAPSHSIRPKVLNHWNDRMQLAKLRHVNGKKEVLLDMTLSDVVPARNVYNTALSLSKLCVVALNIGSLGFFWFDPPRHASRYYEQIVDLDTKNFEFHSHRGHGLLGDWKLGTLTDQNLQYALECMAVLAPVANEVGDRVFSHYLLGLALVSRSDIHLSHEDHARDAFIEALRRGSEYFEDWDGQEENFVAALHRALEGIVPEEADRVQLLDIVAATPRNTEGPFADAISAKRLTDLYFCLTMRRLFKKSNAATNVATAGADGSSA